MKRGLFISAVRWWCVMVLSTFSAARLAGTPPAADQPVDPMAETKRINEELRKLHETPIGKKIADMENRFDATFEQFEKAREELREQFSQIQQTEAYRDYQKSRQAFENKRQTKWAMERKTMAEAARKLYAARHAELKKLSAKDTRGARQLGLDILTYPRVDGSTSTHPLSVIIASRVLGSPYEWMYPEPTGSPWRVRPDLPTNLYLFDTSDDPPRTDIEFTLTASRVVAKAAKAGQERLAIMINRLLAASSSTHDAYINLIEGKCDLNLTARPPSDDESTLARNKGIKIELRPIARD